MPTPSLPSNVIPGLPEADDWVRSWVEMHQTLIRSELSPGVCLALGALGLLGSGAFMARLASSSYAEAQGQLEQATIAAAVCALLVVIGVVLWVRRARRIAAVASTLPPAVVWLRERPHEVVWIYPEQTRWVGAYTASTIRTEHGIALGLATGQSAVVNVKSEADRTRVLAQLQRALPHATVGYTEDLARQFERDPASLRKTHWR